MFIVEQNFLLINVMMGLEVGESFLNFYIFLNEVLYCLNFGRIGLLSCEFKEQREEIGFIW